MKATTTLLAHLSLQSLTPWINADVDRIVITPAGPSGPSSPQSEAGESNVFHQEKDAAADGAPPDTDGAVAEAGEEETTENVGEATFSYDRLISKSTDPVRGIDYKRREVCACTRPPSILEVVNFL
jgi:hypothetical protein